MTTYFPVQPSADVEQTRRKWLNACRWLIMETATYLEDYYAKMGQEALVPGFCETWSTPILYNLNDIGIPLTYEIIYGASFFTAHIRLRFPHWDRCLVYYPVIPGTWHFHNAYLVEGAWAYGGYGGYGGEGTGEGTSGMTNGNGKQKQSHEMLC